MSQSNSAGSHAGGATDGGAAGATARVTWGTKVGYIGTGVLIGLIIYPFVRKALSKVQPKFDKIFDDLTGKAEHLAEKAADIMSRAKENLKTSDRHEHGAAHAHDEHRTTQ